MTSNETLVAQVQASGDDLERRALFGELVAHHQEMARAYAYTLLGDRQLAEDATQEAFITAYHRLPQLREPKAFPAWLRRIVHTQCHRLLRRRRFSTQPLETAPALCAEQPSPEGALENLELQDAVHTAIESLPTGQQIPVQLYYLDNYSQQEIAEFLDLSVSAVKKRLERARYQLEERMLEMAQDYLQPSARDRTAETGALSTFMEAAAREGQFVLVETLLVEGMDVNEPDDNGQTLLHWAARAGHLEAVELLLVYHPDPARRDRAGRTALQLAVEGGHRQVADRLRQYAREQ